MNKGVANITEEQIASQAERENYEMRTLDSRVVMLWKAQGVIGTSALLLIALFVLFVFELDFVWWVVAFLFVIASGVAALLLPAAQFRRWRYAVREHDVLIRHGVLWRTTSIVPHFRIQHVDTNQNPIERLFGLASIVIHTAGTVGAALTIEGLKLADAETLRDHLADLSGTDDAV